MICIIPARGGSKRLPGKNLRTLDGEFIINRVIKIAKASCIFGSIIVSTDSEQIRDIVIGASVSMRPEIVSGDIPEDEVLKWTLDHYWALNFCRIYPFAVLLTPERLRAGYEQFNTGEYENVHECQEYSHPIQRGFDRHGNYRRKDIISLPTQSLETYYHDAGTFMFSHKGSLDKTLSERKIKWIPVTEMEAQDIDDENDWQLLEAKWYYRNK